MTWTEGIEAWAWAQTLLPAPSVLQLLSTVCHSVRAADMGCPLSRCPLSHYCLGTFVYFTAIFILLPPGGSVVTQHCIVYFVKYTKVWP